MTQKVVHQYSIEILLPPSVFNAINDFIGTVPALDIQNSPERLARANNVVNTFCMKL